MPYLMQRKQFGKPLASFQLMQGKMADMFVKVQSARSLVYNVARMCDDGKRSNQDSAASFLLASENAVDVALESMQSLGGNGYINEYPCGRFVRDAKLYDIGGGTKEIRRWLIGREIVKAYSD